jgi:hypothetical protein
MTRSTAALELGVAVVPSTLSGGCACAAVRYACTAAPVAMVNCHCRDCQRAGGAAYAPTVIVAAAHFRILRGEPRYHESLADSGSTARRAFCAQCGSPLFASSLARADMIGIRAASLDDSSWYRPDRDVWTDSAQPWDFYAAARAAQSRF